jgi:fructoselysine-6-P-deglycase FrlB-like protein
MNLATDPSYMAAELISQPDCWQKAVSLTDEQSKLFPAGATVAIIGCGTSWFMAQAYAALREAAGQGITDAFAASEAPLPRHYDGVIALTRSGTTSEVLNVLRQLRGSVPTIAIVGDPDTEISELADTVIALPFADEQSVVQTRFATTALAFLRASLGEDLSGVIAEGRAVIASETPQELVDTDQTTFLGTGWSVGIAHEAALKMREASQAWTESYAAMEYRHGPIAIAAPGRTTWMFGEAPSGLANDVAATGARFEDSALDPLADLVRAQIVSLARARNAGLNPDQPRNLTRSVVLEP